MTQEEKAQLYDHMMHLYGKLGNQIQLIKSESIDLNQDQLRRIEEIKKRQNLLLSKLKQLF